MDYAMLFCLNNCVYGQIVQMEIINWFVISCCIIGSKKYFEEGFLGDIVGLLQQCQIYSENLIFYF